MPLCTHDTIVVTDILDRQRDVLMVDRRRVGRVLTCEDTRLHKREAQMVSQLEELLEVDDIYVGTEAGPEGAVLHCEARFPGVFRNAEIIRDAKQPEVFAIVGHYDCAGHHVSDGQHDHDVVAAANKLSRRLFGETGKVVPIIAYPNSKHSHGEPTWLFKRMDAQAAAGQVAAE